MTRSVVLGRELRLLELLLLELLLELEDGPTVELLELLELEELLLARLLGSVVVTLLLHTVTSSVKIQ